MLKDINDYLLNLSSNSYNRNPFERYKKNVRKKQARKMIVIKIIYF